MAALEVLLFGGFQLRTEGEPLAPIPSRAARSLLARLVLERGVRHSRERLAAQFWPDLPPARARRRLSHTLWQIQDALGELPGGWDHLQATAGAITIARDAPCWVDVEEFEQRLDRVRATAGAQPRRAGDLDELEHAVELYRGDFLAGHHDEWVEVEQQRLGQRYLDALSALIGLTRASGDYAEALVYARRLTHHDPLREDAHREVMRLCTLLGRTSDALRQYERCREVLAEELGTEPAAATQQLYRRIQQARHRTLADPGTPVDEPRFPARLPLAGRDRERADGVAVLEDALAGRGGLVLVEADPGHGKSRLLAELVDDGLWRGFRVLQAACRGPEVAGPYTAVRQLLEPALTSLRVEQLRHRVEPVWLGVVAQVLPSVAAALPSQYRHVPAVRHDEAGQRLRHALVRTITALAGLDPLLLVVDDLQWIDEASLGVLGDVAAEAPTHGLALLLGYRGDDARERREVWDAVRDLDRRIRPTRIVLGPLDVAAVADIVRAAGGPRGSELELAERLQRETGGSPLFVVETLRSLAEGGADGDVWLDEGGDVAALPLPATIRDLVLDRLAGLSSEERTVIDVAAVGGEGTDLDILAAASDLPRLTVVDAADLLVRRALLTERHGGFGLHHDQIRRVVLDDLSSPALRALHRRVGDAIEQFRPDAVDRLAHHFVAADDSRRGAHYLRAAGRAAAAVHAYTAAADYLDRAAAEQQRRPASVRERFGLLGELADVLTVTGDRDRQLEVITELAELAAGSAAREVEVLRRRALLAGQLGDHDRARADADRAVALAADLGDDLLLAEARFVSARVLAWGGQRRAAVPLFVRAVRTAGLPVGTTLEIRATLASVLRELRRYRAATVEIDAALTLARAHDELREEAHALGVLGTVRMETGQTGEATVLYGQAIDRCREIGFRRGEGINLVNRGNVHYVRRHVSAALADYEAAAVTFAQLGDRRGEAIVRLNLGVVAHTVLGADTRAATELRAALDWFASVGDTSFEAAAREALAGVALRAGDLDGARSHLGIALALPGIDDDARGHAELLARRAELALTTGETTVADAAIAQALDLAERHELDDLLPGLHTLSARRHLAAGHEAAALEVSSAAVAALHDGVERSWLVRLVYRDALVAAGNDDEALSVAADAAAELAALLAGLSPEDRATAEAIPEHRRILAAAARVMPQRASLLVASGNAPLGRPLRPAEMIEVEVELAPGRDAPDDPVERRRWLLARVADDIAAQGGAATTADLARVLAVSEATVRRDLHALRESGHAVATRGRRAG
ncbi:MAG TPA: BTAD domain-containing putative transcriptional regulator [Egicoccus sp.]|nr:BTAD domain-containing putative transcriptional regulator [Egicoccus sp.]HSK21978.1 BTAD domain-containing putative transcriptional regulator [Egicoccus sp.]